MKTNKSAVDLLKEKMECNYEEYKSKWMSMQPQELIDRAGEISSLKLILQAVPSMVSEDEAKYLLRFKNPLDVVTDEWCAEYGHESAIIDEELEHALWRIVDTRDAEVDYEMENSTEDESEGFSLSM